jgi:hypothetical protein
MQGSPADLRLLDTLFLKGDSRLRDGSQLLATFHAEAQDRNLVLNLLMPTVSTGRACRPTSARHSFCGTGTSDQQNTLFAINVVRKKQENSLILTPSPPTFSAGGGPSSNSLPCFNAK